MLSHNDEVLRKSDVLRVAVINNPNADKAMKLRLGWVEPVVESEPAAVEPRGGVASEDGDAEEPFDEDFIEETDLSKYQELQEMAVSEKIKMALTGDKEWRTLLIRESNKQVHTAVLKNPRITEGEVLAVAKIVAAATK